MKQFLIADSGGTKTDWCFVDSNGKEEFFTTESYHASNWGKGFFQRNQDFWEKFDNKDTTEVYFFGAGCFHAEKCTEIKDFLKSLGFSLVVISSDLHSAAISSWGENNGKVAILGTGSVLFDWENNEIVNKVGGRGHLLGDEGSGYYFGKLVLEAYQKNHLSLLQKDKLNAIDVSSIDLSNKYAVAQLARLLKNEEELFASFHRENVKSFIDTHFKNSSPKKICVIGSYGFYYQVIIQKELNSINVEVVRFVEKPITLLVEQKQVFIE